LLVPKVQETGVDKHVANIMAKLNVNTRAEIAVWYERYTTSLEPK
jgi:DNA-binding CsgD family transcriptional regulator